MRTPVASPLLRLVPWLCACAGACIVLGSPPAAAQQPPARPGDAADEMERARKTYLDGDAAYKVGKFDEAAQRYEEAYRAMKLPSMLFDMAQAHRRWFEIDRSPEHLKRALDLYRAFLRDAPQARQVPVAERLIPEVEKTLADEQRRRRTDAVARASGREGLRIVDELLADNDPGAAALVIERIMGAHGNPRDVVVGAYQRRALAAGRLGSTLPDPLERRKQGEVCLESFKRALALDPSYVLADPAKQDDLTRTSFELARTYMADVKPIEVSHGAPAEVPRGQAAPIEVNVLHDTIGLVREVALYYRRAGSGAFLVARAPATGGAVPVEIPPDFLAAAGGTEFEYYVAALDEHDSELAVHGGPDNPFRLALAPEPVIDPNANRPWWKRWPVWAGVIGGVLAIGAAATLGVTLAGREEPVLFYWDLRGMK